MPPSGAVIACVAGPPSDQETNAQASPKASWGVGAARPMTDPMTAWRAKGVAFPLPPTKQPWGGTLAQLADPDGNLLTLDQYRPDEHA